MAPAAERISPLSGFGSVTDVPRLPEGFTDVFKSHRIDTGKIGLHAVIGGSGEPLLLHIGWPQSWFAWRYLMLPLSRHFTVIAVDPRGFGLSDRPADGFDVNTLADDMFGLMDTLGHEHFIMAGHDVGLMVGYAMAAMRPERIRRIALGEGIIIGASPPLPLIPEDGRMNEFLWHMAFNRALDINERLVEGREDVYFNYQFATKAASADAVPKYARDFYIEFMRRVPGTLKASFDHYRAFDQNIPQLRKHMETKIEIPLFTFAGALACGEIVGTEFRTLATNVESMIIPECGHYPAEEKPEELLVGLLDFFLKT